MRVMPSGEYPRKEEETKPKSESIFNLINDKENLNRINKIANEGVNHIVAAFFIKSAQQSKSKQHNDTIQGGVIKRSPISSINLNDANCDKHITNMFNDKLAPDVNETTVNQLNTVSDVVKRIKENKLNEIIEKEYNLKK